MTYPDYIGREAVRRLNEAGGDNYFHWSGDNDRREVIALCQLLMETGFKEPEPRDLVMARRIAATVARELGRSGSAENYESGRYDNEPEIHSARALLREYAGEEA